MKYVVGILQLAIVLGLMYGYVYVSYANLFVKG